jgi:hypothetical protein
MNTYSIHHHKSVIRGVIYNTRTAKAVASAPMSPGITKTLYVTSIGRWFFHAETEHSTGPIIPITAIQAIVWLHAEGLPRVIGEHFPFLRDPRDLERRSVVVQPLHAEVN